MTRQGNNKTTAEVGARGKRARGAPASPQETEAERLLRRVNGFTVYGDEAVAVVRRLVELGVDIELPEWARECADE